MGEVYVNVTLTNAVDEGLFRRGLLAPDQVRRYEVDAVVDTGAACTVLPQAIAQRLGLAIRSRRFARHADSHYAELDVTESLVVDIDGHDTTDEARPFTRV